jgi:hypothetical protein
MSIQNKMNELQLLKAVHGMMLDEETVKQKGIDAQIQDTMHLNEITTRLMTATNQANTLKEKIREADMRNQAELARIAEERQYHQGMLDVQREKRESALLDKPAQAGFYYDKNQRGFMTDRPTVGEVKDQPSRFVRMSTQDKATMTFLDYAIGQMEGIHDLANKVLGQGPVMGPLAAVTAKYRKGKGAQDMADFVGTRARLLTEGTRLETGGNRILKDVLNNVRDQFPDAGTDPDVARRKLTSLKTAFEQRVHGMIGREPLTTEKSDEIYFELTGHLKGDQLQKALKDPEVRKQAEKIARDRGYDW